MLSFENFMNKIAYTLMTALVALALAGPVWACDSSVPLPALVNAVNLAWGTQGGNGEEVGLAVNSNTGKVYATDFNGRVSLITQGAAPYSMINDVNMNPDLQAIYWSFLPESTISVNTVAPTQGTYSQGIALDPKTGNVYVASEAPYNTVNVINEKTNAVIATISMTDPRYPAVDSETGKVYVTSYSTSTVSVIDEKTNTVVATIPVGSGPQEVAVDPKTQKAYVINFAGGTVSVISTQTNSVIATIPVGTGGANPRGMALDPKTGKVYVANYFAETISVIDENSESVIATIPDTGYHPVNMVADSVNGAIYVVNRAKDPGFANGATALVIDEQTDTVTGAFNVFSGPRSIAIDQKSGLLYIGGGAPNQAASVAIYQTRPYFNFPAKVAGSVVANTNVTWAQDANLLNTLESENSNLVNLIIGANNGVVSDSPNYFDGDSYVHVLTTADFGPNGTADYWGAIAFINYLNSIKYNGSNHWALPSVSYDESLGYNQIDNAFGKLYYVTLGATAGSTMPGGTFSNVQYGNAGYWFGSEYAPNVNYAWFFSTNWGYQFFTHKNYYNYVWPVSPGPSKCAKH